MGGWAGSGRSAALGLKNSSFYWGLWTEGGRWVSVVLTSRGCAMCLQLLPHIVWRSSWPWMALDRAVIFSQTVGAVR
jgi:hypothetical protein